MIVSPSILSSDFANLEREINLVTSSGAEWIHVDVMDGHFVPNITIGAPVVKSIRKITRAKLDVHLMIDNPDKYIDDFINAGSDIITFHAEARTNIPNLLAHIKNRGKMTGLAIKPRTDISAIINFLPLVDMALIMTVEPGFSGQRFMPMAAQKIQALKMAVQRQYPKLIIQVDGGINDETGKLCRDYGAKCLVAGNYIFQSRNPSEAVKKLVML